MLRTQSEDWNYSEIYECLILHISEICECVILHVSEICECLILHVSEICMSAKIMKKLILTK